MAISDDLFRLDSWLRKQIRHHFLRATIVVLLVWTIPSRGHTYRPAAAGKYRLGDNKVAERLDHNCAQTRGRRCVQRKGPPLLVVLVGPPYQGTALKSRQKESPFRNPSQWTESEQVRPREVTTADQSSIAVL